ncbi:hypothetical protein B7P43_G00986 [Cryptotermes secundus]|uniref:Uncharacterized protein n=1 Tax=Cryptotermes secundus TaxID=105785 RepID=A0A2J7PFY4_9NEOP|nr:hypothetical protein B7P43_G00986 [Cryptotermes secundus]
MCDGHMKERWETETSTENKESVCPLDISLEETSEEESNLDEWQVPLGQTFSVL